MFKKIFTIVVPVLAITAAILIFGIKVYNDSYSTFAEDGYVLGLAEGKEANKYYFLKENKYKVNESKDEVVFVNTEDEEITIPNDTFVHYTDGSLATFKKAVVLNIPNVKNSTLQYYNVYEGSVFSKVSDGHQIDYLDQKLAFKDFMIKLNENKYMIVGKGLTIKYGEEEKTISDGFIEIEYLDGNIIKITNQDLNIQNISKDLSVTMDGITVDLLNKKIVYDGETKVNLGEITIDSDDNIEIIPDEESNIIEDDESLSVEHFEDQPITAPNVNIGGMQSGVVDTSTKRPDEVVEENETVPDAEFDVTAISVTTSSVNVNIDIKDEANVLNGDLNWKVVETATNNIVCMGTQAHGQFKLVFSCAGLAPETNYAAIVRSAYTKNDVNYEKDFVQKTFVTKTIGMTIEKDYVKTNEVAFNVEINGYSTISSFNYDLIGPEGILISDTYYPLDTPATTGTDVVVPLVFNTTEYYTIRSNSNYQLKIHDIVYANEVLSDTYGVSKTVTTLKKTPTFSQSTVAVNKQSSKFLLYLNNVNDPDNGAVSYRADIYDISKMNSKADIVTSRTATTASSISVDVDGTIIQRNVNYRAKMYLIFYDNEMEYEIYLGTQDMLMNSVKGAAVTFTPSEITHEAIRGSLVINDENETLDLSKELNIIYQNASIGSSAVTLDYKVNLTTLPNRRQFTVAIDNNNLKSNSSYLYTIMGWIDYKDGNGSVYSEIGTFWVTTAKPTDLNAIVQDLTSVSTGVQFKIQFQLDATDVTTQGDNPNEMRTMEKISFRISSEDYDPSTECIATNRCWEKTLTDTNAEDYQSTLKGQLFDNAYEFTPTTFSINAADLTYGNYKFEVLGATDYTDYENPLPIKNGVTYFNPNADAESVISNKVLTETVVYNNGGIVSYRDPTLNTDTIIGYKINPDVNLPDTTRSTYKFTYTLTNLTTNATHVLTDSEITKLYTESANDGNNAIAILFKDVPNDGSFTFERGNSYGIKYCVKFNIGVEGKEEQETCSSVMAFKTQPVKQTPAIEAYLSRSGTGVQYWKYTVNDVDNALIVDTTTGISGQYKSSVAAAWSQILCADGTATKDCLKEANGTFVTKLSSGEILVKTRARLLKGAADSSYGIIDNEQEIQFIDGILISSPVEILDDTKYTIKSGSTGNDIKIVFSNYTVSYLISNVVHVKITFKAPDNTTATIFKDIDDVQSITAEGAQVSVDFSEIPSMMGKGNITADVELIYDRNLPGYETEDAGQGFAIEELINGSTSHVKYGSKYKIYNNVGFDYASGNLSFTTIEGSPSTRSLLKSTKGMYYENASGYRTYVNLKVLDSKEVGCITEGGTCSFHFNEIRPTFYLEDTDLTPLIAGVRGQATLVVDSSLSDMVIIARYYEMAADGTCSGTFVSKTYNYSEVGNAFNIEKTDLKLNQGYCLQFTYKTSPTASTESNFFYGAAYHNANPGVDTRVYKFTTLEKPTIQNFKITYDVGTIKSNSTKYPTAAENQKQHDDYNRSMTVSFSVDTLENYNGFDFAVKNHDTGEVVANISIPSVEITDSTSDFTFTFPIDATSTFQTIEVNQNYDFSIIAYKNCTAIDGLCTAQDVSNGKKQLASTDNKFTYYIVKPTLKIQRIDYADDKLGEFSIKVTVSDKYRAAGGYSLNNGRNAVYVVTAVNDLGATLEIGRIESNNYWKSKTFTGISHCSSSETCTVYVSYEADMKNNGEFLTYTETKEITIAASADIGISSLISTSTSGVKIAFVESYMITSITHLDYTISNNVTGLSTDYTDIVALWHTDAEGTYYYLDLNIPLSSGTYTLDINFKDARGKLVANKSYDVIIN